MSSLKRAFVLSCAVGALILTGCGEKKGAEAMTKPPRPAELNLLDRMVGDWKGSGEMTMMGSDEVTHGTGASNFSWQLDNRVLVERSEFSMGEMGTMQGMGTWTWDDRHHYFHTTWVDSTGGYGSGRARTRDNGTTWKVRGKSVSPMGTTTGRGTMTFVDENTMNWEWAEYTFFGLIKVMEMEGTSTRQPASGH